MYNSKTNYLYLPETIAGFRVDNISLDHKDHLIQGMTLFAICVAVCTSVSSDTSFSYFLLPITCCQGPRDCICLNFFCRAPSIEQCMAWKTENIILSKLDSWSHDEWKWWVIFESRTGTGFYSHLLAKNDYFKSSRTELHFECSEHYSHNSDPCKYPHNSDPCKYLFFSWVSYLNIKCFNIGFLELFTIRSIMCIPLSLFLSLHSHTHTHKCSFEKSGLKAGSTLGQHLQGHWFYFLPLLYGSQREWVIRVNNASVILPDCVCLHFKALSFNRIVFLHPAHPNSSLDGWEATVRWTVASFL